MKRTGIIADILLSAALICWAAPAFGQMEIIPDSVAEKIMPIPLTEVTTRSGMVSSVLLNKSSVVIAEKDRETIRAELDSLDVRVSSLVKQKESRDLSGIASRELDIMKRNLENLKSRAETDQNDLRSKAKGLENERLELGRMSIRWNKTLMAARNQEVPRSVIDRINSTTREIHEFDSRLQENLDFLLVQLDRVATQIIRINQSLSNVNSTLAEGSREIMSFNREPLWKELTGVRDSTGMESQSQGIISNILDDVDILWRDFQITLIINIILLLVVLATIFFFFSQISRFISSDEDVLITAAKKLVRRPVSAGLLLGLAISNTLYGKAPESIRIIIAILTLAPLTLIISDIIPAWFRKPVYLLIVMDVMIRGYNLNYQDVLVSRLVLLGINLLAVTLLSWVLLSNNFAQRIRASRYGNLKFYLLFLSLVLLVVGLFANVFGGVLLSGLLVSATITSIINAFLFYTLFLVTDSLTIILMKTGKILKFNVIRKNSRAILQRFSRILSLLALLLWFIYTMRVFSINEAVFGWLGKTLSTSFKIGSLELSVWNILSFFIIIWLTIWLTRIVRYIFEDEIITRVKMKRGVPGAVILITRLSMITIGFLIAVAAAGVDMGSLAILLGALGVGIGFGLQNIFNNLVSGIILAFERPINEGDIIELGPLLGTVKEIGIRASTIKTYDGAEVIVPNGNLISNELINWTLADKQRRVEVLVGVAYGTDPQKVIDLLLGVVNSQDDIPKDPKPLALFTGFGNSSLDFRLLFWISDADNRLVFQSRIAVMINKAILEAGIEIPFPQRDLHLRSVSGDIRLTPPDGSTPSDSEGDRP